MKPSKKKAKFLPIEELKNYTDPKKYFCYHVSFSPEEDDIDFYDSNHEYPPPFIEIMRQDGKPFSDDNESIYFEIPAIIAYYGKTHPGYTYRGIERHEQRGADKLKAEIRRLLDIE